MELSRMCGGREVAGRSLREIDAYRDYWFDWVNHHPETGVFKGWIVQRISLEQIESRTLRVASLPKLPPGPR